MGPNHMDSRYLFLARLHLESIFPVNHACMHHFSMVEKQREGGRREGGTSFGYLVQVKILLFRSFLLSFLFLNITFQSKYKSEISVCHVGLIALILGKHRNPELSTV